MSKKRVQFADADEIEERIPAEEEPEEERLPFKKKFKHTLDSDEEDDEVADEKRYDFEAEGFDGEEEGNLHREGEITITPFNVKDELKEGHFDNQGMYIFKKEDDEIRDNWIDNIDWQTIKEMDQSKKPGKSSRDDDDESDDDDSDYDDDRREGSKIDLADCLTGLIELMNPNETVQQAIMRLGKSKFKKSNQNRNKNRQNKKGSTSDEKSEEQKKEEKEEEARKTKLNSLIDLSNKLLNDGDMNIYEKKYEALKYQLEQLNKKPEMDIFAD